MQTVFELLPILWAVCTALLTPLVRLIGLYCRLLGCFVKMFKVRDKSGFSFEPLIDLPEDAAYHSPDDRTNHLALPHR